MIKIGIIGGSGMDNPNLLQNYQELNIATPYGQTSSPVIQGTIKEVPVAIISRHSKNHNIIPSNVPYKPNIYALKKLSCTHILATTAVGSLRENIKPGDLVFPDQFIDHTKKRQTSFFDRDKVIHLPCAEPFCPDLRNILFSTASQLNLSHHRKGTVITIEGPRFSTKAESHMFRSWGADVINMSSVPEVNLANEARICYATIAMSTDFDCFLEDRKPVTFEEIMRVMNNNVEKVKTLILESLPKIKKLDCECKNKIQEEIL
ncbi:MAG: S-methyl-5'-thioadenosine phosphorylase [Candidatus Woesearchaeota archaeon]